MNFLEDLLDSSWLYYDKVVMLLPKLALGVLLLTVFWWVGKNWQNLSWFRSDF